MALIGRGHPEVGRQVDMIDILSIPNPMPAGNATFTMTGQVSIGSVSFTAQRRPGPEEVRPGHFVNAAVNHN
jgi:hypothetical protein